MIMGALLCVSNSDAGLIALDVAIQIFSLSNCLDRLNIGLVEFNHINNVDLFEVQNSAIATKNSLSELRFLNLDRKRNTCGEFDNMRGWINLSVLANVYSYTVRLNRLKIRGLLGRYRSDRQLDHISIIKSLDKKRSKMRDVSKKPKIMDVSKNPKSLRISKIYQTIYGSRNFRNSYTALGRISQNKKISYFGELGDTFLVDYNFTVTSQMKRGWVLTNIDDSDPYANVDFCCLRPGGLFTAVA
jgi:hypothetical protein